MVRMVPKGNGAAKGNTKEGITISPDDARKIRYGVFFLALVFILFRGENSTVRSVQDASREGPLTIRSASRTAPAPAPAGSETVTVNRYNNDDANTTALPPDIKDALEESRRDNMTIRFSNETWVTEWRDGQAAKRERKPVRNIDWSQVACVDSTEDWQRCDLSDDRWGVPVVLISFGRSGSSITWETMSNLASERGQPAREDIGGSSTSASKELNSIKREEHGKCWLERILCRHQYNNRAAIQEGEGKAEIIGTKWKPFLKAFNHTKSREALEWLAGNPHIKVILNERNFLDGTRDCCFGCMSWLTKWLTLTLVFISLGQSPLVGTSIYTLTHPRIVMGNSVSNITKCN